MVDSATVRVRPWPGLILDGIPPAGADIPAALAEEWIDNRLVVRSEPIQATPTPARPTGHPSKGVVNARKRRRSR